MMHQVDQLPGFPDAPGRLKGLFLIPLFLLKTSKPFCVARASMKTSQRVAAVFHIADKASPNFHFLINHF
jgi:hypothetical protein